ncbi:helix-turn-helix transcriptional regulator [Salmonella enterica subsp. enterica serovar Java]|nr:helix-turn-helix transcriptional regulator [Salmonella enterica subsp. enterica serovar Hvittingfoss]EGP2155153.1 helix-turn-helix transcriptional regulator [Salmonella enterica subsp. enterica serovar Java]EJE7848218.1 helix-turn-helix transcriptional regulator [Salmonella enterica]
MQEVFVEHLHKRLKEELDRCGLSAAKVAQLMGEASSQGLRDVLGGRKRLSAEVLAAIAKNTPIDPMYVLMGVRSSPYGTVNNADEAEMLAEYREGDEAARDAARYTLTRVAARKREAS